MDIHPEAHRWIDDVRANMVRMVRNGARTQAVHRFVQLGVDPPDGSCDCRVDEISGQHGDVLVWLHLHHRQYNQLVFAALTPQQLEFIAVGIERDIALPTKCRNRRTPSGHSLCENSCLCTDYGNIVQRAYGRALIDNFLRGDTWR